MNSNVLEDRLAAYRPVLDAAINERAERPSDLVHLDPYVEEPERPKDRGRLVAAAAVVVAVGVTAAITVGHNTGGDGSLSAPNSETADTFVPSSDDGAAETVPGVFPPSVSCSDASTQGATAGTLYLGQPTAENLAVPEFIYAEHATDTILKVGTDMMMRAVYGVTCGANWSGGSESDGETARLTSTPPGGQSLTVKIRTKTVGDIIGVVNVQGATTQITTNTTTGTPTIAISGLPADAKTVDIRFRKGDNVWSLLPGLTTTVPLNVPEGETDPTPNAAVTWVLVTVLDDHGVILDVAGTTLG